MLEYREKTTTHGEEPRQSDNLAHSGHVGHGFMDLAAQYGLGDDMAINNLGDRRRQTTEEEYQAYVTAPHPSNDVSPLKFWEVSGESGYINGVN